MKEVIVYCDGSVTDNTDPKTDGGIGNVFLMGNMRKEVSGYLSSPQTNNTAEILALYTALIQIKEPCRIKVYCDSMLVVRYFHHIHRWRRSNPRLAHIAKDIDKLLGSHSYEFYHVKGHNKDRWNERADELAETGKISKHFQLVTKYFKF